MNSLLTDFNLYKKLYNTYNQTGFIDLGEYNINPTTILPLILDCFSDSDFNSDVKVEIKKYLNNYSKEEKILFEKIDSSYDFRYSTLEHKFSKFIGEINEKNTFYYFFAEILSNINDHSKFNNAYILSKKQKGNIIDLAFLDDGVSLPYTLQQYKEDNLNIYDATKGLSSKKEEGRGFGLPSTIKIISAMFQGEIIIASRNAMYFKKYQKECSDNLNSILINGTLVSMRFDSTQLPNIYSII